MTLGIAVLLLSVYACFPTKNHYWDGIAFSLNIEQSQDIDSIYYNPNHLFYNLIGWLLYTPLDELFPGIRALRVLSGLNMIASVATSCTLLVLGRRFLGDMRLSLWLTLLFAFSATWWKFSTDANTYVTSICCLVLCVFLLTSPRRKPPTIAVGLLHALSMLLHQIAIFAFPALVVAIWNNSRWTTRRERLLAVFRYAAVAGMSVSIAYCWVWIDILDRALSPEAFLRWVTFNGSDTLSFRSLAMNSIETVRSSVRVFFGGRLSLALNFVEKPVLAGLGVVILVCLAALAKAAIAARRKPAPGQAVPDAAKPRSVRFLRIWVYGFLGFLFIWLTEYPYYRLFYLPALILLFGVWLNRRWLPAQRPFYILPAFVVLMLTCNFVFLIYPYSKVAASPPLKTALEARTIWEDGTLVLYKELTADNWTMKYFNHHTTWVRVDLEHRDALAGRLRRAFDAGRSVWMDTTLHGQLTEAPELLGWMEEHATLSRSLGISDRKHHIRFTQLTPARRDP